MFTTNDAFPFSQIDWRPVYKGSGYTVSTYATRYRCSSLQDQIINHPEHNHADSRIAIEAPNGVTDEIDALATRTGYRLDDQAEHSDFQLFFATPDNVLTLRDCTVTPAVEVSVDFCAGRNRHRQQYGGGLGQPLARAVNARKLQHTDQMICDATGGFGRDALVFASLGCQVVILERSMIVYELLRDAINRAQRDQQMADTAARMRAHHLDSTQLPSNWPRQTRPHTIYLDPMYPRSSKSAAAKKEMQTLKRLFGQDSDESNDARLLESALKTATHRVVIKRPKNAPPVNGSAPVGDIKSANTRYDIYHPG